MSDQVLDKRKGYTLEGDLMPIMEGKVALPNAKPLDGDVGAAILHYRRMHAGYALLPEGKKWDVRFFLDCTQGGSLTGTGICAWTVWKDGAYRAFAWKFAICRHELKALPGANPSRGWHAAACIKCGLDMSVDSGD